MGFACCGMYSAYHVERLRLQAVALHGDLSQPSPVSMFLQVPQFAFVAFAEIFVYTTIVDFAISQAQDSMKSRINAVNTFMGSIANVIAGVSEQHEALKALTAQMKKLQATVEEQTST